MKKRAQHDEPAWPKSIIVSSTPSLLLTVSTLDWKGGKRSIYTPHCQFDLVKLVMQIEGKDFLFHKRYFEIPLMDEIIIIIMINSPQLPSNLCMYIFLTRARTQEAGCNHNSLPLGWSEAPVSLFRTCFILNHAFKHRYSIRLHEVKQHVWFCVTSQLDWATPRDLWPNGGVEGVDFTHPSILLLPWEG